jgi:hypothetical protein
MEPLIILIGFGTAMALFCIPVMAIYTILEANDKKKEIRKYVRKQIMKQLELEKQVEEKKGEKVDLFPEWDK